MSAKRACAMTMSASQFSTTYVASSTDHRHDIGVNRRPDHAHPL
jgi:hypothetical protein